MPNTRSAKKRLRQNLKRNAQNKPARTRLRNAVKKVRAATSTEDAEAQFRSAVRLLDRAATRGMIHRNQAARTKSRLAAHVHKLGGTT